MRAALGERPGGGGDIPATAVIHGNHHRGPGIGGGKVLRVGHQPLQSRAEAVALADETQAHVVVVSCLTSVRR
jgi:hypothetical protein